MNREYIPKDKRLLPTEGEEQARLFSWCRMQSRQHPELELLFHIPNGGSRNKAEAGRFKAEGVKAGVPDLLLPVPRGGYHGLFIELKRLDGGRLRTEQKVWLDRLRAQGYRTAVCRGWEEASEALLEYLKAGETDCHIVAPITDRRTMDGRAMLGPTVRNDREMGRWAGTSASCRNDAEAGT